MSAYYNEHDVFAAAWLRALIAEGLIAPGEVDERGIEEVRASDLTGFSQYHFFAGIGGWSYALRLAGWPDDRAVWTGSCPCQPFSVAGRRKGVKDGRHLWPEFERLIAERRPAVVFGEQVASKAGRAWLSGVRVDLEALGYAVGAADLCAAGVGAPHIRQRLWWVADAERNVERARGFAGKSSEGVGAARAGASDELGRCGGAGGVADADRQRRPGKHALLRAEEGGRGGAGAVSEAAGRRAGGGLGDANDARPQERRIRSEHELSAERWKNPERPARLSSIWSGAVWIPCGDGKARRIEPGLEPLAYGVPDRVGRLRGYGNAIVPQLAATFIEAYADAR